MECIGSPMRASSFARMKSRTFWRSVDVATPNNVVVTVESVIATRFAAVPAGFVPRKVYIVRAVYAGRLFAAPPFVTSLPSSIDDQKLREFAVKKPVVESMASEG